MRKYVLSRQLISTLYHSRLFLPRGFSTARPERIPVWSITPTLFNLSTFVMIIMSTLAGGWNYSFLFLRNDYLTFKQMLASERMPKANYCDQTMHRPNKERSLGGNLIYITSQESLEHYLGLFVGALSSVTFSSISLPKERQRYMSKIIGSYIAPVSL